MHMGTDNKIVLKTIHTNCGITSYIWHKIALHILWLMHEGCVCSKREFNYNKCRIAYYVNKLMLKELRLQHLASDKNFKLLIKGCFVSCYQVLLQNKMVMCDRNYKSFHNMAGKLLQLPPVLLLLTTGKGQQIQVLHKPRHHYYSIRDFHLWHACLL